VKREIKRRGKDIVIKCVEMSHSSAGGEYEIALDEEVELDLDTIARALENSGYHLEESRGQSLTLSYGDAMITVLRNGGILIEQLNPDAPAEAMRIAEEIMNAEQKN
jgi:hypothetical protein